MANKGLSSKIIFALILAIVLFGGARLVPWSQVDWGKISLGSAATITVSGEAKGSQAPQLATFRASVTAYNDDKDKAVAEVNQKMTDLISGVKAFGVAEADIQTQNVSVYETPQIMIYPPRKSPGKWQASNSVAIKLRDISKASGLTDLLQKSGATGVSGPSFSLDDTQASEVALLGKAVENAREKAEALAKASGRTLGKATTITEGGAQPVRALSLPMAGGGESAPIEPGTETLYKSVTVTFELK